MRQLVSALLLCSVALLIRKEMFALPYRQLLAVASTNSVEIYDFERTHPLAHLSGLHCTSHTDLSWSCDGQALMISSTDGYCSVVMFEPHEIGVPIDERALPESLVNALVHAKLEKEHKRAAPEPTTAPAPTPAPSQQAQPETVPDGQPKKRRITPHQGNAPN
jgi:chromatin assembly factor 1 subunit B